MRVLISVSAWPTHYAAVVPLAWALQAGGHEVRVLCQPSQSEPVARAGLTPVPVLDGMGVAVHNRMSYLREALRGAWPYPWLPLHPITGAELGSLADFDLAEYRRTLEPEYARRGAQSHDEAVRFARAWRPDLVLHDPVSTEGLLAARVLGVPCALALWGPVGTHEQGRTEILPQDLGASFERHGCEPFGPGSISHVIDPCPEAVRPSVRGARFPVRFIPYNGAAVAPAWLHEPDSSPRRAARITRPRVAATWSTALTAMSGPNSYILPLIVEALADEDLELVLTATADDVAALGAVPSNVRVLDRCPLNVLLNRCDLVLHHGGAGSAMTALAAGVPQLAVSFASEQAVVGERLGSAGVARHLPGHQAAAESIRAAVRELLDAPQYRKAAGRLREDNLAGPTPVELSARLERWALGVGVKEP